MDNLTTKSFFEYTRIAIPKNQIKYSGKASKYLDILDNSQNLTEEFLYAHQPLSNEQISIYSTSILPIGILDRSVALSNGFSIIKGPAIVVARKGYAGNLYVVSEKEFIVHEDAYPIRPKLEYASSIIMEWFVGHYSEDFQSNRTSFWGIGDFPRERFNNMNIIIPKKDFQSKAAKLYIEKTALLHKLKYFRSSTLDKVDEFVKKDHLVDSSIYNSS